jgi:hypothetical protein
MRFVRFEKREDKLNDKRIIRSVVKRGYPHALDTATICVFGLIVVHVKLYNTHVGRRLPPA